MAVNGEALTTAKPSSAILQGIGSGTIVKLEFTSEPQAVSAMTEAGQSSSVSASQSKAQSVQALDAKAEADAAAKNPVSIKLEEHGLAQYADALGEQGYDSMVSFNNMTNEEAGALADELKMKPGHKRAFITAFACE